jgi:hypothetical protein
MVKFDDDIERRIHVDDVLAVEMPLDPEPLGGSVLIDFDDQVIWACLPPRILHPNRIQRSPRGNEECARVLAAE